MCNNDCHSCNTCNVSMMIDLIELITSWSICGSVMHAYLYIYVCSAGRVDNIQLKGKNISIMLDEERERSENWAELIYKEYIRELTETRFPRDKETTQGIQFYFFSLSFSASLLLVEYSSEICYDGKIFDNFYCIVSQWYAWQCNSSEGVTHSIDKCILAYETVCLVFFVFLCGRQYWHGYSEVDKQMNRSRRRRRRRRMKRRDYIFGVFIQTLYRVKVVRLTLGMSAMTWGRLW